MISSGLVHANSVQASILDIERRRLSTMDMYNHALMSMAQWLDGLMVDLRESSYIGNADVIRSVDALLQATFNAISSTVDAGASWRDKLSTRDSDLRLVAYSVMRNGISELYRNHYGRDHESTCPTCVCLWKCAGMLSAVERINAGKMAVAKTQVRSPHAGHPSHRAEARPHNSSDVHVWHVECPTCGVLAILPISRSQAAVALAVKHRRSAATLSGRSNGKA